MENILHKTKTRFHLMLIELIFPLNILSSFAK